MMRDSSLNSIKYSRCQTCIYEVFAKSCALFVRGAPRRGDHFAQKHDHYAFHHRHHFCGTLCRDVAQQRLGPFCPKAAANGDSGLHVRAHWRAEGQKWRERGVFEREDLCAKMLKSCNGDRGRWILISYNLNSEKSLTLTKVLPSWVCANCGVALGKTDLSPFSNSYLGEKILTNKQDWLSQVGGTFNWTIFCPKIARNKNHTISRIQSADSECASCNVVHILSPLCRLP